ncbi:MAG: heavy-metal-associated domain-containing protein [Bacteroidales bacterium]
MTCSHCEMRVINAIKTVQGVNLEKIDLLSAEVQLQEEKQEAEVIAAIKAVGYEVTEVKNI